MLNLRGKSEVRVLYNTTQIIERMYGVLDSFAPLQTTILLLMIMSTWTPSNDDIV